MRRPLLLPLITLALMSPAPPARAYRHNFNPRDIYPGPLPHDEAWDVSTDLGVRARVLPVKEVFAVGEPVVFRVEVRNTSEVDRGLVLYRRSDSDLTRATPVYPDADPKGPKAYTVVDVPVRLEGKVDCTDYHADETGQVLTVPAGKRVAFDLTVGRRADCERVSPGLIPVRAFLRLSIEAPPRPEDPTLEMVLPYAEARVVDRKAADAAFAVLERRRGGHAVRPRELGEAIRTLADNPDPAHVPLLLEKLRAGWPAEPDDPWYQATPHNLWEALSSFEDPRVAAEAMAAAEATCADPIAAGPGDGRFAPADEFRASRFQALLDTVTRNRKHLDRASVLRLVHSPAMADARFAFGPRGYGLTRLVALVANEKDIPLLARLVARNSVRHVKWGLEVKTAFLKHPAVAKPALRELLERGAALPEGGSWGTPEQRSLYFSMALVAEVLAEARDTDAVPVLGRLAASRQRDFTDPDFGVPAVRHLAQIDGPEAVKALRKLGPAGLEARLSLRDPAAVDEALTRIDELSRPGRDSHGTVHTLILRLASLFPEGQAAVSDDVEPRVLLQDVRFWWFDARLKFVRAFREKYGFDPDFD